jgi:hypothetical protein
VRRGGWILIPAGAPGSGVVVRAEGASSNGLPGELELRFDDVSTVDGQKVLIDKTPIVAEGKPKTGAAAHKWGPGNEATITPKIVFSIVVDAAVKVQAVDRLDSPITH